MVVAAFSVGVVGFWCGSVDGAVDVVELEV